MPVKVGLLQGRIGRPVKRAASGVERVRSLIRVEANANPEHLDLLRQGVDVWNEWRANNSTDNSDGDLRGVDLAKATLSRANLWWSDLSRADLRMPNSAWRT
jgi:hypothetical protein